MSEQGALDERDRIAREPRRQRIAGRRRFASLVALGNGALLGLGVACGARTELAPAELAILPDATAELPDAEAPLDARPDAPADAALPDGGPPADGGSAALCEVPDAGAFDPDAGECENTLVALEIVPSDPSCFIDEVVSQLPGTLVFPCGGGPATVAFGDRVFEGAVTNGFLDVCIGTEFPWGDGCEWQSAQHLSGLLVSGVVSYSYAEQPKPGQQGCLGPCSATGTLSVE